MKLKSNDPLQLLLREAMHAQRIKASGSSSLEKLSPQPILKQCERKDQWTIQGTVALIHRDLKGRETYLGAYDVQVSHLFRARRFMPSHATPHGKLPREVVSGDYWLHQQTFVPPEESLHEVQAIERRFKELMDLYKDIV